MKSTSIISLVTIALLLMQAMSVGAAGVLQKLGVSEAIQGDANGYRSGPGVDISFTLSAPADVTIRIARHAAMGDSIDSHDTPVLPEPPVIREIHAGKLEAGAHKITWDGLDEKGQLVIELIPAFREQGSHGSYSTFAEFMAVRSKDPSKANTPLTQDELIRRVPVDLFRITVQAGGDELTTNFERLNGPAPSGPVKNGMINDGMQLADGDFVVLDYSAWSGYRLGPNFQNKYAYPKLVAAWNSNSPVEANAVCVDSHGMVYAKNRTGVYKYNADGSDGKWDSGADYTQNLKLGVQLKGDLKGDEKDRYWSQSKEVDYNAAQAAELLKQPGFTAGLGWGGFAISPKDEIYLAKVEPAPFEIQVFDTTGKYLRSIPLPNPPFASRNDVQGLHFGKDGGLWVGGIYNCRRVNAQTGAFERMLGAGPRGQSINHLTIDSVGNILGWSKGILTRFSPDGNPLPFTTPTPYLITDGQNKGSLQFQRPENVTADADPTRGAAGIMSVIPGNKGDFYVLTWDTSFPGGISTLPRPVVHLSADCSVLEDPLKLQMGQERPGNIFIGEEPARLDIYTTNLAKGPASLNAEWTIEDLDGKQTKGTLSFTAAGLAREVIPLPLDIPEFGQYKIRGMVRQGDRDVLDFNTTGARIRPRKIETDLDSPFAMCWGTNVYLSGISGVKKERVGAGPSQYYLGEGVLRPDLPDAANFRRGGLSGYVADANRWGVRLPVMLTYGEPWLTSGWMAPIYSYDKWLKDFVLYGVDKYGGPNVQHVQFWNEPDNFLYHEDHLFNREHYALLTKLVWSICKARDKEGRFIPDGDGGPLTMIDTTLPAAHAENYIDGVPAHYPGSEAVTLNTMATKGLPEGKAATVRRIAAIRDKFYPGKPVLITEEGWWGHKDIDPMTAATTVARIFIPEIAAGADEVYWFAQQFEEGPTDMMIADNTPYPAYCAYATMTRMLEHAEYIGTVDLGQPGVFAYLFQRGDQVVMPIWAVDGEPEVSIPCDASSVTINDMMDRQSTVTASGNAIKIKLSLQTQYVSFPRDTWAEQIAKAELKRQLDALKLKDVSEIPAAITTACQTAVSDPTAMARLYYLVMAARQAALAGVAPEASGDAAKLADASHTVILGKEGADGYLREARVAQTWTDRLARITSQQGASRAGGLTWATQLAAQAATALATVETPCYPGAVINAYIGNSGEIAKIRQTTPVMNKPATRIDAQFRFQIDAKPGDKFDLELTVRNFYRHKIEGTVAPRLPDGWTASEPGKAYVVEPGDLARFNFTVTIPADAQPKLYEIGGHSDYQGLDVAEIHTQRVRVQ